MRSTLLALLIPAFLLGACAPASNEPIEQEVTMPSDSDESPDGDQAAAALAARTHLAARLGVDANDITVENVEAREWSDGCLGLGGPAESCLAAITPGFAMTLVHDGTVYHYRTDVTGMSVRAE